MTIVSEFKAAATYRNAGDSVGFVLARNYRYHRQHGRPATAALDAAKRDLAGKVDRYPATPGIGALGAPGERGGRWCEDPAAIGLRFVGWSDEIASIGHSGWFLGTDDQSEVARGCVYAFPARNGSPLYVEAIRVGSSSRRGNDWTDQNGTDGSAMLYLNDRHAGAKGGCDGSPSDDQGARDAAYGADREAQYYGETESEYQARWREGQELAEQLEQAAALRERARLSLKELRDLERLTPTAAPMPALCQRIRSSLSLDLEKAREIYRKASRAWSNDDAFTEGAGYATLAAARKAFAK
jgi:hypothetical protein